MEQVIEQISQWIEIDTFFAILRVAVIVVIALPALLVLAKVIGHTVKKRYTKQAGMLVGKGITYVGVILLGVVIVHELGFKISAVLGAAGIAAFAIGFAAQTSLSNIISGVFLISEKPFAVGDLIRIENEVGTVTSVDLLSVKIRAFDNRYIRIPNENLIKSQLINLTKYPIRRIDIQVGVAYKEDPDHVMDVLRDVARLESRCLDDPEPVLIFQSFGASSLDFLFGAWCVKDDYGKVKTDLMKAIKKRFDEEGIEIPFPHQSMYVGSETKPMPIQIVDGD